MNIGWDLDKCSGVSGAGKDSNQLLVLNGVSNGDGFMAKVHPESGETKAWILPKVNIELFNRVLVDFAQHFGVGKNKRILLAFFHRAGWQPQRASTSFFIDLLAVYSCLFPTITASLRFVASH
ncbi:hypothetical protein [Microcoleus sp. herbarium2]|uniref:hypothetical protein n=1 Tax=Microcoleus sp. herbarium2 TaxID=3055433 RepID=UPI002FD73741